MAHATAHAETAGPAPVAVPHDEHQQHPIKLYLVVWVWLFILSTFSYLVDYFHLHGLLHFSPLTRLQGQALQDEPINVNPQGHAFTS